MPRLLGRQQCEPMEKADTRPLDSPQLNGSDMQVNYRAPAQVQRIIEKLGRTEDIKFSPDNKRLAVSEFSNNQIAIFDVSFNRSNGELEIILPDAIEISSHQLSHPHGIDFISDDKIIVANRDGGISIFQLPLTSATEKSWELSALEIFGEFEKVETPGSVAVLKKSVNLYDVLICNNYSNSVTRHLLEFKNSFCIIENDIALKKWMDIPDGICISRDNQWLAISNHNTHCVLLYKIDGLTNNSSEPDGILGCVRYPHGLKFTSEGRSILVADAGSPYVHIYGTDDLNWQGVRTPLLSLRTMNDDDFKLGRYNPQEGGPKGIDITNDNSLFVTTNECQPIAFFDLQAVLGQIDGSSLQLA